MSDMARMNCCLKRGNVRVLRKRVFMEGTRSEVYEDAT